MPLPDLFFVLGGARSGKSAYAEQLAAASARPVTYVATALPSATDTEFADRIAHHRARRPAHWGLVEAGADLTQALARADREDGCVLIDCLTLWLAQLICPIDSDEERPTGPERDLRAGVPDAQAHLDAFLAALAAARGRVIVVSNEIGLGVVPLGALTRHYVDELGRLNQRVAALAREVTLMVAGLPVSVKASEGRP